MHSKPIGLKTSVEVVNSYSLTKMNNNEMNTENNIIQKKKNHKRTNEPLCHNPAQKKDIDHIL